MCGLVGMAGKSSYQADKVFRTLLILDTIRGEHSTGVCLVGDDGEPNIFKAVGNPFELFDSIKYTRAVQRGNVVMLGHNRWASCGAVNKRNAHPFNHDHIWGAHNGTLTTKHLLEEGYKFEVDSDALFHHLAIHGVKDTMKLLGGAYALSWYDSIKHSINFARNDERPLYCVYSADNAHFFWASEEWMLTVAAEKANLKLGEIIKVRVGAHYELVLKEGHYLDNIIYEPFDVYVPPLKKKQTSKQATNIGLDKKIKNILSKYVGTSVDFTIKDMHDTYKHALSGKVCNTTKKGMKVRILEKKGSKKSKEMLANAGTLYSGIVTRIDQVTGELIINRKSVKEVAYQDSKYLEVHNKPANEEEFLLATKDGCCQCGFHPEFVDSPDLFWIDDTTHLCLECLEEDEKLCKF